MTKPEPTPQAGGSYTRDPKTGKLTRTEFTEVLPGGAPLDEPDAPAEPQAPAKPDTKEA